MIITCPACTTQFRLPDGALGASGRKLRCSSCRHVWFASPPGAAAEAPAAVPLPPVEAPEPTTARETIVVPAAGTVGASAGADTIVTEAEAPEPAAPPAAADTPDTVAAGPEPATPEAPAPVETVAVEDTSPPETAEGDAAPEEAPVAPHAPATVGWEPGAIAPRGATRPVETPRSGLRLVQQDRGAEAEPAAPVAEPAPSEQPAAPSYDVTRVVQPDAAPDERSRKEKPRRRRGGGLLLVLLILVGLGGLAYFERIEVMRYLPQTASLYAMAGLVGAPGSQGLQLRDVSFRVDEDNGAARLVVSGTVVNVGMDYRLLPPLHGYLLDADREPTLTWSFDARASGLAPGDATLFEASYDDPPRTSENEYVFVTFADQM